MGYRRMALYLAVRVMRLSAASDSVPRGLACGVAASFFPIFGTHALFAMGLAVLIRANIIAAALGTLFVPPVILPLVFSLDFLVGRKILVWSGHSVTVSEAQYLRHGMQEVHSLVENFEIYFLPAFTGSVFFMILVWPAAYMATHKAIEMIRHYYNTKSIARKAARKRS